jgi:hypothetical protein
MSNEWKEQEKRSRCSARVITSQHVRHERMVCEEPVAVTEIQVPPQFELPPQSNRMVPSIDPLSSQLCAWRMRDPS